MMTGRLYIDGKDAYTVYGVYVEDGGWNELVAFPPLKPVEANDWQEEDGTEPDLSDPVLDTRTVSIKFAVTYAYSRYFALIQALSDGAYHTFNCSHIQRTFRLRLVGVGSFAAADILGEITLKFADDFPLDGYRYRGPESTIISNDRFQLDTVPFSDYGVHILQGSLSEIVKTPEVKQNLLRDIQSQQGAIYDAQRVTYKAKDVKLSCLMRAETLEELWRNYDALLYNLIRPEERLLWVDDLGRDFPCYYKQCSVSEFYPEDRIWLRFDLTLTFFRDLRITDDDMVLASEDNIIIFTEDGNFAIELLPDRYKYPSFRFVNSNTTLRLTGNRDIRFNN